MKLLISGLMGFIDRKAAYRGSRRHGILTLDNFRIDPHPHGIKGHAAHDHKHRLQVSHVFEEATACRIASSAGLRVLL